MTKTAACVADSCVMIDMGKGADGFAPDDVTPEEWQAAVNLLRRLLDPDDWLTLVYSKPVLREWSMKGVLNRDYVKLLLDMEKLLLHAPVRISGGQRGDLGVHIESEDQCFVLLAAGLPKSKGWRRYLVSRDPKSCQAPSVSYVKRVHKVSIVKAAAFLTVLEDRDG